MIKVYYFLRSEDELTLRQDAIDMLSKSLPAIDAALLSVAIKDAIPERPAKLSGVLELWFRGMEDAEICSDFSPSVLFTKPVETASMLMGMERVVMRTPAFYETDGVKGIYAFRRKEDMPVKEFQHYWWHGHGPIAAKTESATCYVQCHVAQESYTNGSPTFDGVTELYWPDMPAALSALGSRQMIEDQSNDARNFVDIESVDLMMAKQNMIIPPWRENL